MTTVTTRDGVEIFHKDWGQGQLTTHADVINQDLLAFIKA